jgi:hypothetical protein
MPALLSVADFEAFLSNEDPRELLATAEVPVKVFRCHSPILKTSPHRGPEPIEMLPGF